VVDQPGYAMENLNSSNERTGQTGQRIIKHKDIENNIDDDMDETVINHGGMFIKLGVLQNIPFIKQTEWSDVSRNNDISMGFIFLVGYIVVYMG
jgi:hypothetical protein